MRDGVSWMITSTWPQASSLRRSSDERSVPSVVTRTQQGNEQRSKTGSQRCQVDALCALNVPGPLGDDVRKHRQGQIAV